MKTENKTATYSKYCPNVWLAKCTDKHQKDDIIEVEDVEEVSEKPEPNKQQFQRLLKAYRAGNITIEEIESEFTISEELREQLIK